MLNYLKKGISTPIAIGIILILAVLVGGFTLWQYSEIRKEEEFKGGEITIPEKKEIEEETLPVDFKNNDIFINWIQGIESNNPTFTIDKIEKSREKKFTLKSYTIRQDELDYIRGDRSLPESVFYSVEDVVYSPDRTRFLVELEDSNDRLLYDLNTKQRSYFQGPTLGSEVEKFFWIDNFQFVLLNTELTGLPPIFVYNLDTNIVISYTVTVKYKIDYSRKDEGQFSCEYKKGIYEFRVYDSERRVTGLINGQIKLEVPSSDYYEGDIIVFNTEESYIWEIFCVKEGNYQLTKHFVLEGEETTFNATNIPIFPGETHRYEFDWEVLAKGGNGATLIIDSDGDGEFEKTIAADTELTCEEFILQSNSNKF